MSSAGLREVERAKADGRWDAAYPPQSKAAVPADLQAALDSNAAAGQFFLTLTGVNRYAVLHRIHNTKGEAARAAKIAKFVEMLARGETLHPAIARPASKSISAPKAAGKRKSKSQSKK